jgi:hypothetical protein
MKNVASVVSAIMITSLLSACGSQPAQVVYQVPNTLTNQQCFVTQSEEQIWFEGEDEWNELPKGVRHKLGAEEIDFTKNNVLIVSAGQKPTSGYALELTNWLLEQDYWQVTRLLHQPAANGMSAQVITSPCLMVKIPKSIKSFTLNDEQGQSLGHWPY